MVLKRRAPGQRRRRSRRADELKQVEEHFPHLAERLTELRKINPQAYRKSLARLIRRADIHKGRTFLLHDEDLVVLDESLPKIQEIVRERLNSGRYEYRRVAGLLQEEKCLKARPDVLNWLQEMLDKILEADARHLH